MITILLPEPSELKKINIRPDKPKYHPPTKGFENQNIDLPSKSGVYFIYDAADVLIYVGKCKNIRARAAHHISKNCFNTPIVNPTEPCRISYLLFDEKKNITIGIERIYIELYRPKYNDLPTNFWTSGMTGYQHMNSDIEHEFRQRKIIQNNSMDAP